MSVRTTRARLAAVARHAPGTATEAEARRVHREAVLTDHIHRIVDNAPALRPDQLARLRQLLTPAPAGTCPVEIGEAA